MSRQFSAVMLLVLFVAGTAFGQKSKTAPLAKGAKPAISILNSIPDTALGFAVINRLNATSEKIEELAKIIHTPAPPLLDTLKAQLSIEKGLDDVQDVAIVFMSGATAEKPAPVVLVPVSDYKEFISQFEPDDAEAKIATIKVKNSPPVVVAQKGRYAVMAPADNKKALEQVLEFKVDMASSIPKPLVGWIAKNEASVVVAPSGIKVLAGLALAGIELTKQAKGAPPAPGLPPVPIDAATTRFGEDLFKALPSEISYAGVGLWVDPSQAVHLTARLMFVPGGSLAKEAAGTTSPQGDLFAHVPAEPYVFAWGGSGRTSLSRKVMELMADMMRANPALAKLDEEQTKQLKAAFAESVKGIELTSGIWGIPQGDESMYARMTMVTKVEDSATYLANSEKMINVMRDVMKKLDAPMKYDAKMGKLDAMPMLEFSVDMSAAMPAGGAPGMAPPAKLFGPDGKLTTYMVAVDKQTVVASYVNQETARKAVERYRQGGKALHSDPEVAKTSALLPKDAQMRGYLSPHGLIAFIKGVMTNMGAPFGQMIPDVPETPPIGMAARIAPAGVAADLVIPGEVLEAIGGLQGGGPR